mmetsp:Transcript_12970/g.17554  ORF Transcript_12970/g.17554 Transcript_12970/m.17554 type:complete len:231 (-) Transcript_12970:7-699(-)
MTKGLPSALANSTPRRTSIDLFGVKILVIEDTIASPTTVPTLENDGKFLPSKDLPTESQILSATSEATFLSTSCCLKAPNGSSKSAGVNGRFVRFGKNLEKKPRGCCPSAFFSSSFSNIFEISSWISSSFPSKSKSNLPTFSPRSISGDRLRSNSISSSLSPPFHLLFFFPLGLVTDEEEFEEGFTFPLPRPRPLIPLPRAPRPLGTETGRELSNGTSISSSPSEISREQ